MSLILSPGIRGTVIGLLLGSSRAGPEGYEFSLLAFSLCITYTDRDRLGDACWGSGPTSTFEGKPKFHKDGVHAYPSF